jgi:hypothetical protein
MRTPTTVVAFAVLLGTAACAPSQSMDVANLSEPAVLTLVAPDRSKPVFSLEVKGTGSIDGAAHIELMLNGKPYRSERLEGRVSFTWTGDWYSPSAELRYRPTKVQSGDLQLRYRFGT